MSIIRSRVHGGIITDQMLKGELTFFEMTGPFGSTISSGSVVIPGLPTYGGTNTVGNDRPVPGSAAEKAFLVILGRATVSQIQIVDSTTIQFALENTDNAWDDAEAGDPADAASNMQDDIRSIGVVTVPDSSDDGFEADMNTVVVVAKPVILKP